MTTVKGVIFLKKSIRHQAGRPLKKSIHLIANIIVFALFVAGFDTSAHARLFVQTSPHSTKSGDLQAFQAIIKEATGYAVSLQLKKNRKHEVFWDLPDVSKLAYMTSPNKFPVWWLDRVMKDKAVNIVVIIGQDQCISRGGRLRCVYGGMFLARPNSKISVGNQIIDMGDMNKHPKDKNKNLPTRGAVVMHEIIEAYISKKKNIPYKSAHNYAVGVENIVAKKQGVKRVRTHPNKGLKKCAKKIDNNTLVAYEPLKNLSGLDLGWKSYDVNKDKFGSNDWLSNDGFSAEKIKFKKTWIKVGPGKQKSVCGVAVKVTTGFAMVECPRLDKLLDYYHVKTYNKPPPDKCVGIGGSVGYTGTDEEVFTLDSFPIPFDLLSPSQGKDPAALQVKDVEITDAGDVITSLELAAKARKLSIPGFNDFNVILGDGPLTQSATFTLDYVFPSYFEFGGQKSLKGSICLPGKVLTQKKSPAAGLCKPGQAEVQFGGSGTSALSLDLDSGDFTLGGLSLPLAEITGTGIQISLEEMGLDLSDSINLWEAAAVPKGLLKAKDDWKGLYIKQATVTLPDLIKKGDGKPITFTASNLAVDHQGLTGRISASPGALGEIQLGGFKGSFKTFGITFAHNTITDVDITADINLPYAAGKTVNVDFKVDVAGNWSASLTGAAGTQLVKLGLPDSKAAQRIELALSQLRFGFEEGVGFLGIDGEAGVKGIPGLNDLSGIKFSGLKITSKGDFTLPAGGWLNLNSFKDVDFYAFKFTGRKIGFGSEENGLKWFGFGGNFQLPDEFGIGVSLNEIKFKWGATCSGLCLDVPKIDIAVNKNIMNLKGSLEWRDGGPGDRDFRGAIEASFPTLKFSVGSTLIVGKAKSCRYWYFDSKTQFPSGIPVATNVSIYGFMGGAGQNVSSELEDSNNDGVYEGVKWNLGECSGDVYVFKIGLTLGTSSDNGYVINSDVSFLIETLGPVLSLEGRGWLLQDRFKRANKPSNIYALIRYDGRQDLFLMQVTGRYDIKAEKLTILEIAGAFEVLASRPEWHVYLGWKGYKCDGPPPRQRAARKLSVKVVQLLEANGYFMIGSMTPFPVGAKMDCRPGVMLGAGFDYGASIAAKIVKVYVQAWGSGDLAVSWDPTQTFVAFGLGGKAGFTLFGIDFGRSLDANVKGQYPNPAELSAHISISLPLPFPLPDVRIPFDITFKKKARKDVPVFPHPLRSAEITFPQENRPAYKKGASLTCSGPKNSPCGSGVLGIPVDQDGKTYNNPGKAEKVKQLNPRFNLTFRRPVTGQHPISSAPLSNDVQPQGGWKSMKPQKYEDQVGQFRAWYRFRDMILKEIEEPQELMTCAMQSGNRVKIRGYWGSIWRSQSGAAWNKEKDLLSSRPPVGKKQPGDNNNLVDERRRQLFSWHAGVLPVRGGTPWTDAVFNKESLVISDPPKALRPNTFYQIKVTGRHDWNWPKNKQKGGTGGAMDKLNVSAEEVYFCFRTGPAPKDLSPYVAWLNPAFGAKNTFYGEDLFVLFNTAGMQAVYNDKPPFLVIYDQDGKRVGKGKLTMSGQLLRFSNTALPKGGIGSRKRYFAKVLDPHYQEPVFGFQFTTSQFASFGALMDDTRTLIGGPKITSKRQLKSYTVLPVSVPTKNFMVVTTPEPLPWSSGRVKATLKNKTTSKHIALKRLSPSRETTHVFVREDGKALNPGNYDLIFMYARELPGLPEKPNITDTKELIKNLKSRIPGLGFVGDKDLIPFISVETKILSFKRSQ